MAVPRRDRAVFLGGDRDVYVSRRTRAADLQLGRPIEMQHHGLTGLTTQRRASHAPFVGGKLGTESTADVVAVHRDIRGIQPQRRGKLAIRPGHILRR
jgi:hypothetical protein